MGHVIVKEATVESSQIAPPTMLTFCRLKQATAVSIGLEERKLGNPFPHLMNGTAVVKREQADSCARKGPT